MTDTIRKKIIDELAGLFSAYTFTSVAGMDVYRGRQVFDPDTEPPPLVTILPRVEQNANTDYGIHDLAMPVDIICLARMGTSNPNNLGEAILGELIKCTFGIQTTVGGVITQLGGMTDTYADAVVYKSGGIDAYPDEMGQQIIHVGISIEIRYQTKAGNPYAQQ